MRHQHAPSRRSGFTLVELLVVVGIVTVVVALVLPAASRAREQARRVKCASNIRQVAAATVAYALQNRGVMPQPAEYPHRPHDWIFWGQKATNADLSRSMIAPYLNRPVNPGVLRCPSDAWEGRERKMLTLSGKPPYAYAYSYTMNHFMSSYGPGALRLQQVRASSDKILFVEEDLRTMEDGMWLDSERVTVVGIPGRTRDGDDPYAGAAGAAGAGPVVWEPISARHDLPGGAQDDIPPATVTIQGTTAEAFMGRRGNVAFVDGHVDYVTRSFTRDRRHVLPE